MSRRRAPIPSRQRRSCRIPRRIDQRPVGGYSRAAHPPSQRVPHPRPSDHRRDRVGFLPSPSTTKNKLLGFARLWDARHDREPEIYGQNGLRFQCPSVHHVGPEMPLLHGLERGTPKHKISIHEMQFPDRPIAANQRLQHDCALNPGMQCFLRICRRAHCRFSVRPLKRTSLDLA